MTKTTQERSVSRDCVLFDIRGSYDKNNARAMNKLKVESWKVKIKDTQIYNIFNLLSLALDVRISIATYGKYHAVRHITCADGANIDLLYCPLIHRRRDDGPPSPRRLLRNRGKVGIGGEPCGATGCSKRSAKPSGERSVWVVSVARAIFAPHAGNRYSRSAWGTKKRCLRALLACINTF